MSAKKLRWTKQQRVDFYLRQRREFATETFNAVGPYAGRQRLVERDVELMAAIEAWRQRRLAEIDEALRELGITDPAALQARISRTSWAIGDVVARFCYSNRDVGVDEGMRSWGT